MMSDQFLNKHFNFTNIAISKTLINWYKIFITIDVHLINFSELIAYLLQ